MTRALSAGAGVVTVKLRLQAYSTNLAEAGCSLRALSIKSHCLLGLQVGT